MSNDSDLRFFLAHDRTDSDEDIDTWRERLTELLTEGYPAHMVTVVAGRDDYKSRAKDSGGWKGWPRSVFAGNLWDGSTRFHGIIRPVHDTTDVVCGRPTFEMVQGFRDLDKTAWVWDVRTEEILVVRSGVRLPDDSFKSWGRLIVQEET